MNCWIRRFILSMSCVAVTLVSINLAAGNNRATRIESPSSRSTAATFCMRKSEVTNAVQKLSALGNNREMTIAQQLLFEEAKRSSKCRRQVVDALMSAMDKFDLDSSRDFFLWHYGSSLLADLKATEAIDLLVKHLDFTDGTSINVSHYPAMEALIELGPLAIPKLGADLRRISNRGRQLRTVFCIARIGGIAAIATLREALSSQQDPCMIRFIGVSINALDNKQTPGQITSEDWARWHAAFSCNE